MYSTSSLNASILISCRETYLLITTHCRHLYMSTQHLINCITLSSPFNNARAKAYSAGLESNYVSSLLDGKSIVLVRARQNVSTITLARQPRGNKHTTRQVYLKLSSECNYTNCENLRRRVHDVMLRLDSAVAGD